MTFDEVLEQVRELLQREGRVSYRALKRRFTLDDEYIEDLKAELIDAKHLAVDEDGKVLVWTGNDEEDKGKRIKEKGRKGESEGEKGKDSELRTLNSKLNAAERRQLTVMFCDLVGSTALSTQLDPEELREVVQAYQETCTQIIQQYDGYIAQHLGDGLLVYFGYPVAHEDDATRAVRAGLEIVEAIRRQGTGSEGQGKREPLQVRIGIHTGLVVIGEIGSSEKREILALGETPNIAARIQGQANPDEVVISAATYHLVEGLFECEDRGQPELKGITTPLTLYQVRKESDVHSRFDAEVSKGLTPLVGREEELGLLRRRWEQAKAGEGQVVLLSGEPGIGKSRLVQTLKEHVTAEGATRIEFRCSPYHRNSAFYPLIEHLQRLLQFAPQDTPLTKLDKLRQTLAQYRFPRADTLALFAALLSLPQPEGAPSLTLSPQKQKQKTQEALVAWLIEEAERQPVYCAWEDLHWVDPSTLEVLALLLDQAPTTRILAVLTFRPDFTPPWRPHSHITQITLSRLQRPQVEAMVAQVTGGKALPAEVLQQIIGKTDGVPLFVEELTKTVLESELVRETEDHYELTGVLPPLAIPSTLQDSLMARLDRLSAVREIVQLGATLGREFSYELLHLVSPVGEETLQQGLHQLMEAELIYQHGLPPQAKYLFKHALVQDTAYQSLLKSKRQYYHQKIAQVLEEQFPDTKETQPELLAHHYTEAGLKQQAIPYWQRAGQRATQRSANTEAISHLTRGLEVLKTLPETPERTQQELTLQVALGAPLIATKGYAAPETGGAYSRALTLCQQAGETPQLFPVLWGLWTFYLQREENETAHELAEQVFSLAQRVQDPAFLSQAHYALGVTLFYLGEFAPARAHLEQGISLYNPQHQRSHAFLYGQDAKVTCLTIAALALWLLGYPDQARKQLNEAFTLAQQLSHPFRLAWTLNFAAMLSQYRREGHIVQERAAAELALSGEQGFPYWLALGTVWRGWALAEQGQGEEGMTQIQQGIAAYRATGAELARSYWLALLAEAHEKAEQVEEGLGSLAEALDIVDKTRARFHEAELYRLKGELTLQKLSVVSSQLSVPNTQPLAPSTRAAEQEAEEYFLKAIDIARKQQAKSIELRATASLARLWQQQGKAEEAHQMLAEIYNWFTEGFDTKDLQEAQTLLEELLAT